MSDHQDRAAEELLTRATAAWRIAALTEGPSAEVEARTLAELNCATGPEVPKRAPRTSGALVRRTVVAWIGIAAAATVVGGILLLPREHSAAFEQAIDKLRAAKRLSFTVELYVGQPLKKSGQVRFSMMDPGKVRAEFNDPKGSVLIGDGETRIALSRTDKTAVIQKAHPSDLGRERDLTNQIFSFAQVEGRLLGEETLDGVRTKLYEGTKNGCTIKLWADATSGTPVRIEIAIPKNRHPQGPALQVCTDFKFPTEFDDELFSIAVPAGYKVEQEIQLKATPMEEMRKVLERYTRFHEDTFPPDISADGRALAESLNARHDPDEEMVIKAAKTAYPALMLLLTSGKPGTHYRYFPGAKLGEKDRVVFWCADPPVTGVFVPAVPNPDAMPAPPREPTKFLAIYGDLHVESLRKDQLP
jgi:outer membrane lipoprotein-sorting protein